MSGSTFGEPFPMRITQWNSERNEGNCRFVSSLLFLSPMPCARVLPTKQHSHHSNYRTGEERFSSFRFPTLWQPLLVPGLTAFQVTPTSRMLLAETTALSPERGGSETWSIIKTGVFVVSRRSRQCRWILSKNVINLLGEHRARLESFQCPHDTLIDLLWQRQS